MSLLSKAVKRVALATQKSAEDTAVRNAASYCRIWLGQEMVPKKLLEHEAK